ncbi:hypothetical protein RM553_12820 [Zunongwangia sp. F363]|uniref:Uncharacterized protein n=1 Tax=Autumnicola tepida TaxID=3075595 RepID=A0ABU3CBK0_9FLAO|nr:hypothetical protein [Zunongwangia sp. F363]MDT0643718.1 hypothetical protein [Zunongwangia sp. F363]
MTKKEKILFDLLQEKEFPVDQVWYESNFSWHPNRGWYATDIEGYEYHLGSDFAKAEGRIKNNEIKAYK